MQSTLPKKDSLGVTIELSLLISWRHFLMKKSKDPNWPSEGVQSNLKCFESIFVRDVRIRCLWDTALANRFFFCFFICCVPCFVVKKLKVKLSELKLLFVFGC